MWGGDCLLPAANQCYQLSGYRFSGALDYNSKNVKTNPTVTRYAGTEDVWRFCKGQMIMILFQCERYKKIMIIHFNSVLTQAMLLMMMVSNLKMIIIDQIPPLTNMIFHHPGTFDSCLEVDFQLPPYQQTQVIMMTMTMLTRQSLKTSLASIASSPPTIATLSILKAHTKGDHFSFESSPI